MTKDSTTRRAFIKGAAAVALVATVAPTSMLGREPTAESDIHTLGTPEGLRAQLLKAIAPQLNRSSESVRALAFACVNLFVDVYTRGGTQELEQARDEWKAALKARGLLKEAC
jgi:hypothetical protein